MGVFWIIYGLIEIKSNKSKIVINSPFRYNNNLKNNSISLNYIHVFNKLTKQQKLKKVKIYIDYFKNFVKVKI